MVMRADSYKITSPGSPDPTTFGMSNDPSASISLTPGGGETSTFGPLPWSYGGSAYSAPSIG